MIIRGVMIYFPIFSSSICNTRHRVWLEPLPTSQFSRHALTQGSPCADARISLHRRSTILVPINLSLRYGKDYPCAPTRILALTQGSLIHTELSLKQRKYPCAHPRILAQRTRMIESDSAIVVYTYSLSLRQLIKL